MPFDEDTERKTATELLKEALEGLNSANSENYVENACVKIEQALSRLQTACCDAQAQLDRIR